MSKLLHTIRNRLKKAEIRERGALWPVEELDCGSFLRHQALRLFQAVFSLLKALSYCHYLYKSPNQITEEEPNSQWSRHQAWTASLTACDRGKNSSSPGQNDHSGWYLGHTSLYQHSSCNQQWAANTHTAGEPTDPGFSIQNVHVSLKLL